MPKPFFSYSRPSNIYLAVLSVCIVMPMYAGAQVSTTYKEQHNNRLALKPNEGPDVTGLWYHINQKQKLLANQELTRLKSEFPLWTVPSEIEEALKSLNQTHKRSVKSGKAIQPKDMPLQIFAKKSQKQRALITKSEFQQLSDLATSVKQFDYHMLLGWTAIDKRLWDKAQFHFDYADNLHQSRSQKKDVVDGFNAVSNGYITQALNDNDNDMEKLRTLLTGSQAKHVIATLQGIAWQNYEKKDHSLAYALFKLLGDDEGMWLTLRAQGKDTLAAKYACERTNTSVFLTRCADYLASEQANFYDEGAYQQSVDAALSLRGIRRLRYDEQALLGWASFKASSTKHDLNAEIAKDAFTATLIAQPDNEDVANALIQLESEARRVVLAEEFPTIRRILNRAVVGNAWSRKQFILAYNKGEKRVVSAQTKDAYTVVAGITTRSRSGEYGLGNFDVLTSYVGVGSIVDSWRWQVALDYQQMYSGKPAIDTWFANDRVTSSFAGISGFEDKGLRAEIEYQQNAFNFYANVEYQLFDQPVDAKVTGQLSATWFLPEVTLATTAFHLPKTDSLLSQTGTFNSEQSNAWGYVMADGVSLLAAHSFKPKWSVAGTFEWAKLGGDLVADNEYFSVRSDVSYDIASTVSSHLDYWRVGPFLSYLGYKENLSGFTYGHGGYFSPTYLLSVGGYSELLTMEAQRWQFKLSASLGFSRLKESSTSRFLLLTGNPALNELFENVTLLESRSSGLSGNVVFDGQYRLSEQWIIAGYLSKAFAVEYQSFEAGIQLRWRPGKGNGVTSDELLRASPKLSGFAL